MEIFAENMEIRKSLNLNFFIFGKFYKRKENDWIWMNGKIFFKMWMNFGVYRVLAPISWNLYGFE